MMWGWNLLAPGSEPFPAFEHSLTRGFLVREACNPRRVPIISTSASRATKRSTSPLVNLRHPAQICPSHSTDTADNHLGGRRDDTDSILDVCHGTEQCSMLVCDLSAGLDGGILCPSFKSQDQLDERIQIISRRATLQQTPVDDHSTRRAG